MSNFVSVIQNIFSKPLKFIIILIFHIGKLSCFSQCFIENTGQGLYLYSPVKTKLTLYKPLIGKEWGDTTYRNCAGFGPMTYRKTVPGYVVQPGTPIYAAHSGIIRLFTSGGNDEPNDAAWIDGGSFTTSYFNIYFSIFSNQYIHAGQRIGTVIPRKDTTYIYFGIRYASPEQPTMKRVGLPVSGDNKNECSCYIDPVWPEHFVNPTSWNIHWDYNGSEPATSISIKTSPAGMGAWSFDNGVNWHKSGEKIIGLPQKYYKITFKEINGYVSPLPIEFNSTDSRKEFDYTTEYTPIKSLTDIKNPPYNTEQREDSSAFFAAISAAKNEGYDSSSRELKKYLYTAFNDSLAIKLSAIETEQEKVRTRSIIYFIILTIAVIASIALIFLSVQNRKLKKEKQHVVDLQKELHHRVRNNLGVILGLLDVSANSENKELAVKDLESRIKSISLIHEQLYNNDRSDQIHLQDFLEQLCSELLKTYGTHDNIKYHIKGELLMDSQLATQFALIIGELFTNSLKHAQGTKGLIIIINAEKIGSDGIKVTVTDNGPGYPQGDEYKKTYGIRMVEGLVKQLHGKVQFENEQGAKTTITI